MKTDTQYNYNTHAIINPLGVSPLLEPNSQHGVSHDLQQKQQILPLTCSVHETTVDSKESFCPNSRHTWTLYCEKCDKVYILPVGCHQRTCSFCSEKRQNRLIWEYQGVCKSMQNPVLITLTAPYFKNPRVGQKEMFKAYRRLRQRLPFKHLFRSGIYGFHFKPKPNGMWYVHIHALVDTKFVPQSILSRTWSKCMKGAKVVDIRKAWSPKGGLKYILGYITATKHLQGRANLFNAEMKGTRTVSTTGGMKADPLPHDQFICPYCGDSSYGYAHKVQMPSKWHNFIRRTKPNIEQCFID